MTVLFQITVNLALMALGGAVLFFVFRHLPGPDGKDYYEDMIPGNTKRENGEDRQ